MLLGRIFPLPPAPLLFPALLLSQHLQIKAAPAGSCAGDSTAVGTPVPRELFSSLSLSTGVLCLVFNRSCPEFVIAPSNFIFKGCLTGRAFLLIGALRKAPCEGGEGRSDSRGCSGVSPVFLCLPVEGNNSGAPGGDAQHHSQCWEGPFWLVPAIPNVHPNPNSNCRKLRQKCWKFKSALMTDHVVAQGKISRKTLGPVPFPTPVPLPERSGDTQIFLLCL